LGTVGAGYMNRDQLRGVIRAVKRLTDRPFGVNLFAPQEVTFVVEDVQGMNHYLDDVRESLGIECTLFARFGFVAISEIVALTVSP
ncbi:MAG: nitronate monooxygenase, partial [Firmicutes bacterium]|nr:nitronate monooxygenase [Bacillota bacterium]